MERVEIESIVANVLARIKSGDAPRAEMPAKPKGVYKTVTECHAAAKQGQLTWVALPLEKRREIVVSFIARAYHAGKRKDSAI